MEIRINKEIKDYHESLFFGLSARQFICSVAAVGAAVGVYFGLKDIVGKEMVSWLCVVCAAPLAAAGFFKYNGMQLEEFITAFFRSEFIYAGVRKFKSENILYNLYKEVLTDAKKAKKNTRKAFWKKRKTDNS
ncbi:PrgI family protein [Lachnospiraceae bacterium MD329]|nr:PrgI family protein [Lachnospiraceae bacterium MD329]